MKWRKFPDEVKASIKKEINEALKELKQEGIHCDWDEIVEMSEVKKDKE